MSGMEIQYWIPDAGMWGGDWYDDNFTDAPPELVTHKLHVPILPDGATDFTSACCYSFSPLARGEAHLSGHPTS